MTANKWLDMSDKTPKWQIMQDDFAAFVQKLSRNAGKLDKNFASPAEGTDRPRIVAPRAAADAVAVA
jgi:hypothetical protein